MLHVYSVSRKHHVRLKTAVPEADPKLPTLVGIWRGRELVRARGVGPLRDRLRGPPQARAAADPRVVRRPPDAQGLPDREAPRAEVAEGAAVRGARGLRAAAGQHRPAAPRDARHLPRPGAARRRDDHRGRGRDRLHAPQLREDGGGADLLADHPVHRPPQLLLVVHERARLGARGREAARGAGAAARRGDPRDPVRVLADHGPHHRGVHERRGPGRDHALLRDVPRARGDLRAARGLLRRAAHGLVRADRRAGAGRARRLRGALPRGDRERARRVAAGPRAAHAQRHLPEPLQGRRRDGQGRGALLGLGRALPARLGRRLRRPPRPPLLGLRPVRLRRAGGDGRRLLRPLPRAHGGDPAEPAHHRAGARQAAQGRRARRRTARWRCRRSPRCTRTSSR